MSAASAPETGDTPALHAAGVPDAASAVAGDAAPGARSDPDGAPGTGSGDGAATKPAPKPAFVPPAATPTQDAADGIRFDFNVGARVSLPAGRRWLVRLRDLDTGNVLFENSNDGALVMSSKRYFVRFGVEVRDRDRPADAEPVLSHEYDARDRTVIIQFPVGTLGDTLGWFPYAARFAERHGCALVCVMSVLIIPLFREAYPRIRFVSPEQMAEQKLADEAYATYTLGLFFDDNGCTHQPTDFRLVGLHRTAGYILGVDPREEIPRIAIAPGGRPIAEPYVCIAAQSSSQCKYWNNPHGWREVVSFLKRSGYRVVCIDQKPVHGTGLVWNHLPHGVEDQTGDQPLIERARWLHHAAFFIGLSSGLSWLAWAARARVVLISGFTHPTNEFHTDQRVINWNTCNSCWNDPRERFDHHDFLWCPRHAGTPRQFECTRLITAQQVIGAIRTIPGLLQERPPAIQPKAAAPTATPEGAMQ